MKPDCMQGVDNWRAARSFGAHKEQSGSSEWGLLWYLFSASVSFLLFPFSKIFSLFASCCQDQLTAREKREKLSRVTPFWLQCAFRTSDPAESATHQVYREIEIKAVLGRVSSYVTWSLLFPCTLVGTSALFQHWLHPVDANADRLAYIITVLLTLMAFKASISEFVPQLSDQTFLDLYVMWAIVFVFLAMVADIQVSRHCLPFCEDLSDCTPDRLKFFGFDVPNRNSFVSSSTSQGEGVYCECKCDFDEWLLVVFGGLWALTNVYFFVWYARERYNFHRLLDTHNLWCENVDN